MGLESGNHSPRNIGNKGPLVEDTTNESVGSILEHNNVITVGNNKYKLLNYNLSVGRVEKVAISFEILLYGKNYKVCYYGNPKTLGPYDVSIIEENEKARKNMNFLEEQSGAIGVIQSIVKSLLIKLDVPLANPKVPVQLSLGI